jgi:hypothetical protein
VVDSEDATVYNKKKISLYLGHCGTKRPKIKVASSKKRAAQKHSNHASHSSNKDETVVRSRKPVAASFGTKPTGHLGSNNLLLPREAARLKDQDGRSHQLELLRATNEFFSSLLGNTREATQEQRNDHVMGPVWQQQFGSNTTTSSSSREDEGSHASATK